MAHSIDIIWDFVKNKNLGPSQEVQMINMPIIVWEALY